MVIGVVGKMASGKSTVCCYLEKMINDTFVIDVDNVAKGLYIENPGIIKKLVDCFGSSVCLEDGNLNYNNLAVKIFSSKKNLKTINKIMFPKIKYKVKKIIEEKKHRNCIVIDAAILFDCQLYKLCDYIIWIRAERKKRFNILRLTKNISDNNTRARINGQVIEIKENLVDFIIDNNGTLVDLENKVKKITTRIRDYESKE